MLSDSDYQRIKVSTLTAAEVADRVATSPSTVYYDEEGYARVYEALTMLRHNLCVVYSELDLFRSMFREQISAALQGGDNEGEEAAPHGVADGSVEPAKAGDASEGSVAKGQRDHSQVADGVEEPRAEPQPKRRRSYRRRSKADVPVVSPEVGRGDGASEVGGQAAD